MSAEGRVQRLKRPDGNTVAYAKTEGRAPAVVFLGGFRSDMTGTKAMALETWARRSGRAYLRFDYLGHGQSSGGLQATQLVNGQIAPRLGKTHARKNQVARQATPLHHALGRTFGHRMAHVVLAQGGDGAAHEVLVAFRGEERFCARAERRQVVLLARVDRRHGNGLIARASRDAGGNLQAVGVHMHVDHRAIAGHRERGEAERGS